MNNVSQKQEKIYFGSLLSDMISHEFFQQFFF